jgi:hypothetical protein
MAKDKYTLPEVDSLKEIGFQFEYSRIEDAIPYIKSFVQDNFKVLHDLYFFENASYDGGGNIIELSPTNNSDDSVDELSDDPEKNLVEKIERIMNGKINPRDYLFHVHPVYANDKEVLVKVFTKKLRALYGAKGNLIYRGSRWGLNLHDSISECFHHKILDDLIFKIKNEGKIPPYGISENYFKIKELLAEDTDTTEIKDGVLFKMAADYKNQKELAYYQGLLFSENLTLEKSAKLTIWRSHLSGSIESTILEKERTLKYYLRLQASSVKKAKDNARRNKGIQNGNRDKVINVYKSNPRLSHVKIAQITGVTRKTVAKYIDAFIAE